MALMKVNSNVESCAAVCSQHGLVCTFAAEEFENTCIVHTEVECTTRCGADAVAVSTSSGSSNTDLLCHDLLCRCALPEPRVACGKLGFVFRRCPDPTLPPGADLDPCSVLPDTRTMDHSAPGNCDEYCATQGFLCVKAVSTEAFRCKERPSGGQLLCSEPFHKGREPKWLCKCQPPL